MNMKKRYNNCRLFFICGLVISLFFVSASGFSGCGIDTIYVINSPHLAGNEVLYDDEDPANKTFCFRTDEDNSSLQGIIFLGTDVYYKIYQSDSRMKNEVDYLNSLANDEEKSYISADKLRLSKGSGGYDYRRLKAKKGTSEHVLIPKSSSTDSQLVKIRLTDFSTTYPSIIDVYPDTGNLSNVHHYGKPVRDIPGKVYDFNFGRTNADNRKPDVGDNDFDSEGTSVDDKYYVALFAVSVGQDSGYEQHYSNIEYLGAVTIKSDVLDN